jgi:pimeloyl-ACP methyl ester carboxylesterase
MNFHKAKIIGYIAPLSCYLLLLSGCVVRERELPAFYHIELGTLPTTDLTLNIPGLTSCTDNPDHSLHLTSNRPVYVLVHGCFGSSGQFRGLSQVLAFHGQQTVCFTYNDRARLARSAMELRRAVDLLAAQTGAPQVTVIGHSQGALIAHKALTYASFHPQSEFADFRLVTISGPFGGIATAQTCGKIWLYPLTLGLLPLSCYAVTGAKWTDITFSSKFIREPGTLAPDVSQYLKIDTDERGACRRENRERCVEQDAVFSLPEQRNPHIEADLRERRVEVQAGHVEIVGNKQIAPMKLIAILQAQGAIPTTPPERRSAFNQLMTRIYQDAETRTSTP